MAKAISTILFDLGDTLLDFGPVNIGQQFTAGAKLAYEHLKQQGRPLPSFKRFKRVNMLAIRWAALKSAVTLRDFNAADLLQQVCENKLGFSLSRDELMELCWFWYEPLHRQASIEPHLRELLQGIQDSGVKIAIVSNTFIPGKVLDRHLEEVGLLDILPDRIYSCNVGYRKPHRRIFDVALEQMQAKAEETIFVGDTPRADVGGAGRLGMITVQKDPENKRRSLLYRPAHRIRCLSELKQILANYAS